MQFSAPPQLEHQLLVLRPITVDDIETWFKYLSLPQIYEHTSWNVRDPSDLSNYVWKPEEFTDSSLLRFAVALRSSNELIGTTGFHTVSPHNGSAEIAYDITPTYWGKGIGSAVCAKLVAWAHREAAVTRVQATVLESNVRSAAVLERCGFTREACFRHIARFAASTATSLCTRMFSSQRQRPNPLLKRRRAAAAAVWPFQAMV